MKKDVLKEVSGHLSALLDLLPVDLDRPREKTRAQEEALARLWADNGIRDAIESFIRVQNKNLIKASTELEHIYFKAKIDTLMQLLAIGKTNFIKFASLSKRELTEEQKFHELEKQLSVKVQDEVEFSRDQGIQVNSTESGLRAEAKLEAPAKGEK